MNSFDRAYLDVLEEIEHKGFTKGDRTGTGTISRFGTQARFSLKDNRIPMISLRKVFHRSFIHETLWFLSGSTDIEYLKKNNVSIWDSWVKPGTERYRQMTLDEIKVVVNKYYGEDESSTGVPRNYSKAEAKVEYEAWCKAYRLMREEQLRKEISKQQVEDGWGEVTFVKDEDMEDSWAMEAEVGSSVRQVIYGGLTSLLSLYEHLTDQAFDMEPRVLSGGSIGDGAYGSQWRAWEDTRVVSTSEVDSYLARGFVKVGDLEYKNEKPVTLGESYIGFRDLSFDEVVQKCREIAYSILNPLLPSIGSVDLRCGDVEEPDLFLTILEREEGSSEDITKLVYLYRSEGDVYEIYRHLRTEELRIEVKQLLQQQHYVAGVEVKFTEVDEEGYWSLVNEGETPTVYYGGREGLLKVYKLHTGKDYELEPRVPIDTPTQGNIHSVVYRKIDQIANIVEQLKNEPDSRRILLVAYNPSRVEDCVLPPCFLPGTLISTPDGYRKIEEIKEGDIVYSASMTPRKVNKVWKTDYSGELVGIRQPYSPFPLISTPNHPHYVEGKGYIAAENIETGDSMLIPCRNNAVELKPHSFYYKLDGKEYRHTLSKNDYFTLGYFLGNGWFMENSGNRVCFAIPETKKNYILPIIRETVKVSRKRAKSKTVSTYETRSLKWSYLLPDFGKHAHNKQIPEWIFNSPIEFIEEFLKGYLEADGNLGPGEGGYTFVTTSLKIAYGLQRLWSLFERPCGITYQSRPETTIIEGRVVKQRSTYTVRVSYKAQLTSNSYSDKGMSVMVKDTMYLRTVNRIQVYNLDVEEEHTYIANNYATHNCHSFVQWWTRELTLKERERLIPEAKSNERLKAINKKLTTEQLHTKLTDMGIPSRALSCHLYMRSNDVGVGAVFNIPQYGLLTHMLAQVTGMVAEEFIWTNGDSHIYLNHGEGLNELFSREGYIEEARVKLNTEITRIDDFRFEDIEIVNYKCGDTIKFPVAI